MEQTFHPIGPYPSTSHFQRVRFGLSIPLATQSCLADCLPLTRSCRVQRKGMIRANDSLKAPEASAYKASDRTEHDFGPFWSTPRPGAFCPRHFKHCQLHCVLHLQLLAHISTGYTQHYSDLKSISSTSWGTTEWSSKLVEVHSASTQSKMKKDGVKQNTQPSFSLSLPFHAAYSDLKLQASCMEAKRKNFSFLKICSILRQCKKKKNPAGDLPITGTIEEGWAKLAWQHNIRYHHCPTPPPLPIFASPNMCMCQEICGLEGTGFPQAS